MLTTGAASPSLPGSRFPALFTQATSVNFDARETEKETGEEHENNREEEETHLIKHF